MNKTFRLFTYMLLLNAHCYSAMAEQVTLLSPDAGLSLEFSLDSETLTYSVKKGGVLVLNPTPLQIMMDGVTYPNSSVLPVAGNVKNHDNVIYPEVPVKASQFREHYNERELKFGSQVILRARAYDDAVAFRWESVSPKDTVVVNDEQFSVDFANKKISHWAPSPNGEEFFSHQECNYVYKAITKPGLFSVPMLAELSKDEVVLITDVNNEHYPGLWLEGSAGVFKTNFPRYPKTLYLHGSRSMKVTEREDFLAKVPGKYAFPWRTALITNGAGLLSSNTLYSLATPSRVEDTSWIKPGKSAWDWWNHFTLEDVPFTPGRNQETYKHYIDFAAEYNLPYMLIDDGWATKRFPEVNPNLDIAELASYAKEKNVSLVLWASSVDMEANFDEAFDKFEQWGIAGLKMDFMQRDDQIMNDFCYRVAEEAAKRKMIVSFHGGSKPTGLHRTYPNVLSHESVYGMEQSLWNKKANPNMAVMNAFIRMSVGPMDYTPGAMINMTPENFVPGKAVNYAQMGSLGTRCQQLALYVIYTSPLQMLCDSPSRYRKNPASMDFLREVPTVWDETIVLDAAPCTHLAIARKSGTKWFIGCLTNSSERTISLDLSFLPKGKQFTMNSWMDGPMANTDAQDHVVTTQTVNAGSAITVNLAKGGGFAAIIDMDHALSMKEVSAGTEDKVSKMSLPILIDDILYLSDMHGKAKLFDMSGKRLITSASESSTMDLSNLPKGCYLLVWDKNRKSKIIK
ncbi:MAG: glycoside hydrolase family 97 catalytic domain-containing protein [Bacteroidales bacterium]